MKIILPWPDRRLSPNARLHWRAKIDPKKDAKLAAARATCQAKGFELMRAELSLNDDPIPVVIKFYPPDRRARDDDNIIGSFKHSRDGIAEALSVNDRRFRPHYFFEEPTKPGKVEVSFPQGRNSSAACSSIQDGTTGLPPETEVA